MPACNFCKGSGRNPIFTSGAPRYIRLAPCPFCRGTGAEKSTILREHEDGDADGLGFFRGCLIAIAGIGCGLAALWILTALLRASIPS
jgi:hypothetical protein